jgi:hypothetical protein
MDLGDRCESVDSAQGGLIKAAFDLKTLSERPINFVEDLLKIEQTLNTVNEAFLKLKVLIA